MITVICLDKNDVSESKQFGLNFSISTDDSTMKINLTRNAAKILLAKLQVYLVNGERDSNYTDDDL